MKQRNLKTKVQPSAAPKPIAAQKNTQPTLPPPDWEDIALRYALPALGVLLVLAFLLRVANLTALSLWVDEFVHVQRADQFVNGTGSLFTDDNNGILLTFLLLPFFKIFGASVFWARLVSVLFGVGTVWLVYRMGTRLFNRHIGFLAAFASTFSLYLIFWSRMSRNYAIFGFFFLLTGWIFLKAFEDKATPGTAGFWQKNQLHPRYLLLLPVVLLLSFLSHQLAFFFVFSVGIYALAMAIGKIMRGEADQWSNKYFWLGMVSLPFLLTVFIPSLSEWIRQPLSGLALSNITDMALPKWSRIGALWATKPWEAFDIYNGAFRYSPTFLYFFALWGLLAAFSINKAAAWWLLSSLLVPFLLMCFIFREPSLPRYLIFIFPYFLLAASVGLYAIWHWLSQRILPGLSGTSAWVLFSLPFIAVLVSVRWRELKTLVLAEKLEGHVVDMNVSQWAFTNWQEPCNFVLKNQQPGDVVMATIPNAVSWYLKNDKVLWFRQNRFDTQTKRYVPNLPNANGGNSAATFEEVVRTVQSNPRGWLLGDYYLDNIFTDEKTLLWVYQNLQFYPEASKKSGVMVFGWDREKPKPVKQNFVVEVGKWEDRVQSREYHLSLPPEIFAQPGDQLRVTVRAQNVNSNREGVLAFNYDNAAWLPQTGNTLEEKTFSIPKAWVRPGDNTVQVLYDTDRTKDPVVGFTVHFLSIN